MCWCWWWWWWFMHMHMHIQVVVLQRNECTSIGCCRVLHYVIQQRNSSSGSSSSKHVMWFPKMCYFKRSMNLSQFTKQCYYAWSILYFWLQIALVRDHDHRAVYLFASSFSSCVLFLSLFVRSFVLFSFRCFYNSPWIFFFESVILLYMSIWHIKCYICLW